MGNRVLRIRFLIIAFFGAGFLYRLYTKYILRHFPQFLNTFRQSDDGQYIWKQILDRISNKLNQLDLSPSQISKLPDEVDLIISGGGGWCNYAVGTGLVLNEIHHRYGKCKIRRISGASFGTIVANAIYHTKLNCKVDTDIFKRWILNAIGHTHFCLKYFVFSFHDSLQLCLRNNMEITPLSSNIHISVSRVHGFSLKNEMKSGFQSTEDLIDTILDSCAIPLLSTRGILWNRSSSGEVYLDGGFTSNVPLFQQPAERTQVVVHVKYLKGRFGPKAFFMPRWELMSELMEAGMDECLKLAETNQRTGCVKMVKSETPKA